MDKFLVFFIILAFSIGYIECRVDYKCENTTYSIKCYYGNVINITNAFWGRDNRTYCLDGNTTEKQQQCSSKNITNIIGNLCNNNQCCTIHVNTATLGDPCPGTSKYLRVSHFCQKPKNQIYTEYDCQNKTVYVYCLDGGTINITDVFYGRDNSSYCTFGNKGKLCSLANATTIVANKCNGKNFCSFTANATDFPDPCPGVPKYIKTKYLCNPKKCPVNEHFEPATCDCGDLCPSNRICPLLCMYRPTCVCNTGYRRNPYTYTCVKVNECP